MSMEQAIQEHASALNNLASAIRDALKLQASSAIASALGTTVQAMSDTVQAMGDTRDADTKAVSAEIEAKGTVAPTREAINKALDAAKAGKTKKDDAAAAAEARGTTAPADSGAASSGDDLVDGLDDKPLTYADDVRPVLLDAIRKVGKEKVQALLGQFGVDKGDKLKPEQLAAVRDAAKKLAA